MFTSDLSVGLTTNNPPLMSLIAITLIPELTLWLPRQFGMLK